MVVSCPHCSQYIEIIELNCRIFRCGIFKKTFQQIDPHLEKSECVRLYENGEIYGCGKPFRAESAADGTIICVICDYI